MTKRFGSPLTGKSIGIIVLYYLLLLIFAWFSCIVYVWIAFFIRFLFCFEYILFIKPLSRIQSRSGFYKMGTLKCQCLYLEKVFLYWGSLSSTVCQSVSLKATVISKNAFGLVEILWKLVVSNFRLKCINKRYTMCFK